MFSKVGARILCGYGVRLNYHTHAAAAARSDRIVTGTVSSRSVVLGLGLGLAGWLGDACGLGPKLPYLFTTQKLASYGFDPTR